MQQMHHQASSARLVGAGLVVLLHIGIIYALVTGLAHRVVDVVHAITVVTPEKPVAPPPAPVPVVEAVRVMPKIDAKRSQEPEYPPTSRRLGEQGSVTLQVLVDIDGRVVDTKLVQSSGFERLDQAALDGVKGSYRFLPGTLDGKPQQMWYTFKFTWKLR
jgi:protein TonB